MAEEIELRFADIASSGTWVGRGGDVLLRASDSSRCGAGYGCLLHPQTRCSFAVLDLRFVCVPRLPTMQSAEKLLFILVLVILKSMSFI